MAEAKVKMQDVVKSVTLKLRLTGARQFRVRAKLGLAIMKFGARVIGVRVEIEAMEVAPAAPSQPGPPPPPPNDTVEKGM